MMFQERFRLPESLTQTHALDRIQKTLDIIGLKPVKQLKTPWGAFLTFNSSDSDQFHLSFFGYEYLELMREVRTPKLLVIGAGNQLAWQVHQRRAEFWKVINGPVGVKTSETDAEPEYYRVLQSGDVNRIPVGTRHRLTGLEGWGVVAEMWLHTDTQNLSAEDDIRRINDFWGRK